MESLSLRIISSLSDIRLCSANYGIIESHLVNIGRQCDRLRQDLIKHARNIKTNDEYLLDLLKMKLNHTVSIRT